MNQLYTMRYSREVTILNILHTSCITMRISTNARYVTMPEMMTNKKPAMGTLVKLIILEMGHSRRHMTPKQAIYENIMTGTISVIFQTEEEKARKRERNNSRTK